MKFLNFLYSKQNNKNNESNKNNKKNLNYIKNKKNSKKINNLSEKLISTCNDILVKKEKNCQCFDNNNHPDKNHKKCSIKNSNRYCESYNKCKKIYSSFMSGSEPKYNPKKWSNPLVEGSHNCYAYFLDDQIPSVKNKCLDMCKEKHNNSKCRTNKNAVNDCGDLKPQPGDYAYKYGFLDSKSRKYQCPNMIDKVLKDSFNKKTNKSNLIKTTFNKKCPKNYYKGAMVVDPSNTYHFYRQDDNVRYSHKQGTLEVENSDANGNSIYAPHLADTNYDKDKNGGINYTDFCSYFCIPRNYYLDTHAI